MQKEKRRQFVIKKVNDLIDKSLEVYDKIVVENNLDTITKTAFQKVKKHLYSLKEIKPADIERVLTGFISFVYRHIARPTKNKLIVVLEAMSKKAKELKESDNLYDFLDEIINEGKETLEKLNNKISDTTFDDIIDATFDLFEDLKKSVAKKAKEKEFKCDITKESANKQEEVVNDKKEETIKEEDAITIHKAQRGPVIHSFTITKKHSTPIKEIGIIVNSKGPGMDILFKSLSVDTVINSLNTDIIINAIKELNAKNIVLFINTPMIDLSETDRILRDFDNIHLIPTSCVTECVSCLLELTSNVEIEEYLKRCINAMNSVNTIKITNQKQGLELVNEEYEEGKYVGIHNNKIIFSNKKLKPVVLKSLENVVDSETNAITLYSGERIDKATNDSIVNDLKAKYPEVDIQAYEGKIPVYQYLIEIE